LSAGEVRIGGAYPRSRGATALQADHVAIVAGLSPLARGNRFQRVLPMMLSGPIPARAGQPSPTPRCRRSPRAYPRSRGATGRGHRCKGHLRGLSPLARGNRNAVCSGRCEEGPIPARAGQPK